MPMKVRIFSNIHNANFFLAQENIEVDHVEILGVEIKYPHLITVQEQIEERIIVYFTLLPNGGGHVPDN